MAAADDTNLILDPEDKEVMEEEYPFDELYIQFDECNYEGLKKRIKEEANGLKICLDNPNINDRYIENTISELAQEIHERDEFFKENLNDHRDGTTPYCNTCEDWAKYASERYITENMTQEERNMLKEAINYLAGKTLP